MKNIRHTALIVLICILLTCSLAAFASCDIDLDTPVESFSVGKDVLSVGIISDSQLRYKKGDSENLYQNNLIRALSVLKAKDVDMILFGGDITDESDDKAYDLYVEAFDRVYGDDKPIIQHIMGNHDYWGNGIPSNCRKLFEKKLGQSPWTHYVVNGYHFIGASPDSGSMDNGYKNTLKWLRIQLDKAVQDSPDKPIFVMTHNSAEDTVYGSDDWGDKKLASIFKHYPQVVNFSGHLHYSLLDERSIHQGDFTSITTQSVSYTEMERGKVNGTIPPNADATPMGYVMNISSDKVEIVRVNFAEKYGDIGHDEKSPWILPIPLTKEGFTYTTQSKLSANSAPTMNGENGEFIRESGGAYLQFTAGRDDDFVHSYKLVWSDGKEQLYFSDFYNGIDGMSDTVKLKLDKKGSGLSVKIYAVDSWGAVSENYTLISDISI